MSFIKSSMSSNLCLILVRDVMMMEEDEVEGEDFYFCFTSYNISFLSHDLTIISLFLSKVSRCVGQGGTEFLILLQNKL